MNYRLISVAVIALAFGACGNKPPEPGRQDEVPAPAAAALVGVSTDSALGGMVNAPGNYVRGMAGNVDKAKQAADFAGKKMEERLNTDPAAETGN